MRDRSLPTHPTPRRPRAVAALALLAAAAPATAHAQGGADDTAVMQELRKLYEAEGRPVPPMRLDDAPNARPIPRARQAMPSPQPHRPQTRRPPAAAPVRQTAAAEPAPQASPRPPAAPRPKRGFFRKLFRLPAKGTSVAATPDGPPPPPPAPHLNYRPPTRRPAAVRPAPAAVPPAPAPYDVPPAPPAGRAAAVSTVRVRSALPPAPRPPAGHVRFDVLEDPAASVRVAAKPEPAPARPAKLHVAAGVPKPIRAPAPAVLPAKQPSNDFFPELSERLADAPPPAPAPPADPAAGPFSGLSLAAPAPTAPTLADAPVDLGDVSPADEDDEAAGWDLAVRGAPTLPPPAVKKSTRAIRRVDPIVAPTLPAPGPPTRSEPPAVAEAPKSKRPDPTKLLEKLAARGDRTLLMGFCPVTLRDERDLAEGDDRFAVTHDGVRYRCADAAAKRAFEADPDRYAPAARGRDLVIGATGWGETPGSLAHAVWYRGRLYLFASRESMRRFVETPGDYLEP